MADEKKTKKKDAEAAEATPEVEETPAAEEPAAEATEPEATEPAAEAPQAEADEPAIEETPVAEPEAEEPAAEEAPAEEPAAEEEPPAEEPAADPEPAEPAGDAQAPADEQGEPAPAQPAPKPKRKRLPRSERHKHVKPKRERPAQRKAIVRLPKPEHARGRSQERRGVVVSDAMDKTIVVKVDTVKAHPKYKKVVRRSTKFHAHDEANTAKIGDLVRIVETRPLSKTKNWRLAEVLEEAK
jgi:small subunit ribosomal protein S17